MSRERGMYVPPSPLLKSAEAKLSKVASDVVASQAEARFEHLKDELGIGGIESEEARRAREEEEERKNFWITFGHAIYASVTMIASLISLRIASFGITTFAFGISMVTAPYTVRQRRKLNHAGTLREAINGIRLVVNNLQIQNDRLTEVNDKLRVQVDKLKEVEESLGDVVARQGADVEKFVAAVKENADVQMRMRACLKAHAAQDAVTVVLRSDHDCNKEFDDDEIDELVCRMRCHPSLRHSDADTLRMRLSNGWDKRMSTVLRKTSEIFEEAELGMMGKTRTDILSLCS